MCAVSATGMDFLVETSQYLGLQEVVLGAVAHIVGAHHDPEACGSARTEERPL